MKQCAFLSMDRLDDFVCDDDLVIEPMQKLGWQVHSIPWRQPDVDWRQFEVVLVRSTWDYQRDPEAFVAVLETIDRSTRLLNPLPLLQWNLRKSYLHDLQSRGVRIVPTLRGDHLDAKTLLAAFITFDVFEIVIKPEVGASAERTFRLRRPLEPEQLEEVLTTFWHRAYLAQPFIPAIVSEGEFSLMYFGGELSHTVLKTPKAQDFRSQEEHGGQITLVQATPALRAFGEGVLRALPSTAFYARVDGVRVRDEEFAVMEVELIEPALYFRMDPEAPARFAHAVQRALG